MKQPEVDGSIVFQSACENKMNCIELKACPACKSPYIRSVFELETSKHNSLLSIDPKGLGPDAAKVRQESSQLSWMTCDVCDLIFAGRRPMAQNVDGWYLELFKISEERNYDSFPLPPKYVEGKKQSGADLFAKLDQQGLVPNSGRVLHIRCATAEFLRLAQTTKACKVTGLDFFPSCVKHANVELGHDAVFQMHGPQPENPFPDEKYELIVSNHMLTHAHDPAELISNYSRWLKDDGVLILMNEPDHALALKSWKSYPRGLNFFHKQLFTAPTFKSTLGILGFEATRAFENDGKFRKNMVFVCRKATPRTAEKAQKLVSMRLMRRWALQRSITSLFRQAFHRK